MAREDLVLRLQVAMAQPSISRTGRALRLGQHSQGEPCWQPQPQVDADSVPARQPHRHSAPTQGLQVQVVSLFMGMTPWVVAGRKWPA